jgi:hypothetical protein
MFEKNLSIAPTKFLVKILILREIIIKPVCLGSKELYLCREKNAIHQIICRNHSILAGNPLIGNRS